jgi:hypothetical protein
MAMIDIIDITEEDITDGGEIIATTATIEIGIIAVIRTTIPTTVVYINPQSTLIKGEML